MKLYGVTFTFNEAKTVPYIMPYHVRLGYDKLIVYDNESTDETVELLRNYPFVEVRSFSTGGKLDSMKLSEIKSNAFKEFLNEEDDAWMTVTDFDEVIYYNGEKPFKEFLKEKQDEGYGQYRKLMIETLSEVFPPINGKLCHENIVFARMLQRGFWDKLTMFNLKNVYSLNYCVGAHICDVMFEEYIPKDLEDSKYLQSFHLKYLDNEFNLEKVRKREQMLSDNDKNLGFNRELSVWKKEEEYYNNYLSYLKEAFYLPQYLKEQQ